MKRYLATSLFLFCTMLLYAQPKEVHLRPLEGYFLDPKFPLKEGPNFFIIRDRNKFIKYFGRLSKPDIPNLRFNQVLIMALPPTDKQARIAFMPTAMRAGNYIEVYCIVEENKYPLTYTSYPIVLAEIPKYFGVTKVNFYNQATKELIESVRIR